MTLYVTLQSESNSGRIYPPYLEITYADASNASRAEGTVRSWFEVVYTMDDTSFRTGVSIAMGVTSLLAFIVAVIDTSTWNKRSGKVHLVKHSKYPQ